MEEHPSQGGLSAIAKPNGLGRCLKTTEAGQAWIDREKVSEEARYDGKYVLRTNTSLPGEELALDYKSLWQVEYAFQELKSGLDLKPVYLGTQTHVRGHILVCFLPLLLEATLQRLLKDQETQAS